MRRGGGGGPVPVPVPQRRRRHLHESSGASALPDKYHPSIFRYNGVVALALLPALVCTLGFAHQLVAGAGIIGVLTTTILDLSGAKEATFFGVWITLALSFAGSLLATLVGADARERETAVSLEALFTLGAEAQLFFLVGLWSTIQFKWVQVQHPEATVAMERIVMTATPVVSLVLFAQLLIAAVGSGQAPFYTLGVALVMHILFVSRPMESSFVRANVGKLAKIRDELIVIQKDDALICTSVLLCTPWILYYMLHYPECWPLASLGNSAQHTWSLLLLFSVPLMYLSVYSPQTKGQRHHLLWWSGLSVEGAFAARILMANAALIGLVLGLEGRVLFRSFSQYIHLPAPWNYITITLALYGGGAALISFLIITESTKMKESLGMDITFSQTLEDSFASIPSWIGIVFIISITVGAIALGMTTLALLAALLSAAGLVLFIESRAFREYLLFACGMTANLVWFLKENFWYLDVKTGSIHMKQLCALISISGFLSSLIPGLVISKFGGTHLLGGVMLVHAALFTYLERGLAFGSKTSRFDEGDFTYPPYLVICTSVLGLVIVRNLTNNNSNHNRSSTSLSVFSSWLLQCIYGSKMSMLVLEEAHLVVPCTLLSMAVTAPFALYPQQHHRSGESSRGVARGSYYRMREGRGIFHAVSIVCAVLYARFMVFDILQAVLGLRPSEGLLIGSLLILSSCACIPLVKHHFSYSQGARRLLISVLASGLVIALVRPPMPITGGARCPRLPFELCPRLWDSDHRPEHEVDDVAIYGDLISRREHWPKWLLVVSVISGLAGMGVGGSKSSALARLTLALISGVGIGCYLSFELFPGYRFMQMMVGFTTSLCLLVLAMIQVGATQRRTFKIFVVLVVMLPLSLLSGYVFPPQRPETDDARLYVDVELDLEADNRVSLLMAHLCYMLLVAFTIKLKRSSSSLSSSSSSSSYYRSNSSSSSASFQVHLSSKELVPLIGNIATVETFLLGLALFKENEMLHSYVVFMLCPILLLLNQDGFLFSRLTDRQRYAPVVASIPFVLTSKAFADLYSSYAPFSHANSAYHQANEMTLWTFLLNNVGILLTLPNHVSFLNFLWTFERVGESDFLLVVFTPLNLISILVTTLDTVRVQAVCAILFAAIQFYSGRRIQRRGMQIL